MKISIAIPTYNRPFFLKEAIESCLLQDKLPYEIIIGDDSNNEDTELLIRDNFSNSIIKYHKNEHSLGQLANVNNLIQKASGEMFILLHDDDLLLPNALSSMLSLKELNPEIKVIYGKQYFIDEMGVIDYKKSEEINNFFFRNQKFHGSILSSLECGITQQFPNDAYMIDMDLVKRLGYSSKEKVGNAGDFDFGIRLGQTGAKFYFLNQYTAKYRLTESSVARNGTDSGYQAFKILLNISYAPNKFTDYRKIALRKKAPIAIMQALKKNKKEEALMWYFSKWHYKRILTPGGLKRLFCIIVSFFKK